MLSVDCGVVRELIVSADGIHRFNQCDAVALLR
jgi:hypothetical protein